VQLRLNALWASTVMWAAFCCGVGRAQALPAELLLPPGATVANVQYFEYAQDDFSHPAAKGAWEHPTVAGHMWKAFVKGDAQSLSMASWKSTLSGAGWEVLDLRKDLMVARRGPWWVKIGLDRLTLVQQMEVASFELKPPGDSPEPLPPNQDVPYAAPLPATKLREWKLEERLELASTKDGQMLVLSPAIRLSYAGAPQLSVLEVQTRYGRALEKAGWTVLRPGGAISAHYAQHARDVWVKITPLNGGAYTVEVADLGAAAEQDKLAQALADAGHVALYGIYFDTDKATLRPDSEATLIQIQKLLTSHPAMKLEIQGHTDNTGTRAHNQALSEERAAAVKAWLVVHGIDAARLTTRGYADTKPVADNNTPQGRALNRRVELARP
jgi:outer membrane protein OmpA-like peptidoglycan-associated protein